MLITGKALHPGDATGPILVLDAPVSFWGGVSSEGIVIDAHHPNRGTSLAGTVLVMRSGRGSSSSSSVLAEQIRSGHAPAAILLVEPDTIIVLGAIVAAELYELRMPIAAVTASDYTLLSQYGVATVSVTQDAEAAARISVTTEPNHADDNEGETTR